MTEPLEQGLSVSAIDGSSSESAGRLNALKCRLDDLLRLRYSKAPQVRERLAAQYLRHELEAAAAGDGCEDWSTIEARVLFFACQDVVPHLVRRHCYDPGDRLMQEEMAVYVMERLQRDRLRRIRAYDPDKGAAFSTYLKRVVANLATDFLRRGQRESELFDRHHTVGLHGEPETPAGEPMTRPPDPAADGGGEGDMEKVVAGILEQPLDEAADPDDLRQRLRPHLRLDARERLFLKAIYFNDLSAEQAGTLPGMGMNKHQANSLHRRLLERLADAFRQAGAYDELQSLVMELAQTLAVSVDGVRARIALERLMVLEKTGREHSGCFFDAGDEARRGDVAQPYAGLRKILFSRMLDIRSDAMAAEAYLESFARDSQMLRLRLLEQPLAVQPRYAKRVKEALARGN